MKYGADILKECKRYFMEIGYHNTETVIDLHDAEEAIDSYIESLKVSKKEEYDTAKNVIKAYKKLQARERWIFKVQIKDSSDKEFWTYRRPNEIFEVKHCTNHGELNDIEGFDKYDIEEIYIVTSGEYKDNAILKSHADVYTSIVKDRWGVHKSHCCSDHGCKYGEEECPVVLDIIKQTYLCEMCNDTDWIDEL